MPLLGVFLQGAITAVVAFFADLFAKRIAIRVLAGAAMLAVVTALMLVFNTQLAPLAAQLFSTQYGQFLGLLFPPASGTCLATIATVWVACVSYRLQEKVILMTGAG